MQPIKLGPVWMLAGKQAKRIRHSVKSDMKGLAISMEPFIQGGQFYDGFAYLLSFF